MTGSPTINQRKRNLCLYVLARSDFEQALHMAELADEMKPEAGGMLYWTFNTAIVVTYARPFVDSHGIGRLSGRSWERFGDSGLDASHKRLVHLRHKFAAHSDVDARRVTVWTPGARLSVLERDPHLRVRTDGPLTDGSGRARSHGVNALTETIDVGSYASVKVLTTTLLERLTSRINSEVPSLFPHYVDVPFRLRWDDN